MTMMVSEVYQALKEAKVSEEKAIAAASAIPNKDDLATKEDLKTGLLKLENRILLWMGGMFIVAVGVIGVLLRFFQSGSTP